MLIPIRYGLGSKKEEDQQVATNMKVLIILHILVSQYQDQVLAST